MRGLKSEDLVAMIDFLYFGEANVYQENLDSFLAVAEELQLKGLTGSETRNEPEQKSNNLQSKKKSPKPGRTKNYTEEKANVPEQKSNNLQSKKKSPKPG